MGKENRGSGKSELKAKVTGLHMGILFAASQVLFHTLSCSESRGIPGRIESRCSITYMLQRRRSWRRLPRCQEQSGYSTNPFIRSLHVLPMLSDHLMSEHVWLRGMKWLVQCDTVNKGQKRHLHLSCLALHFTTQAVSETGQFWPLHEFTHYTSTDLSSPRQDRGTSHAPQSCRKFFK